jgi:NAD(P)-dependent dehydrogenase (short-subunit alcohol dehydrogenase family)
MRSLVDQRVLVVGASSGLGRHIGVALGQAEARVALAGRRAERLDEAAKEAGNGAVAIPADVQNPEECDSLVARAVDALGGLDALVYCPGVSRLGSLADAHAEVWRETLTTNVVGAALVARAAIPHLTASSGRAILFSSESVLSKEPWPGLGPYVVSKAALDKLIEALRVEHPEVAFTRFVMGASGGGEGPNATEFASAWDPDVLSGYVDRWIATGRLKMALIDAEDVSAQIIGILSSGADIESVIIRPR